MQECNVSQPGSGLVSLDSLIPPRPKSQPCPCCFDLDAPTALQNTNDLAWSQSESVIRLSRSRRNLESSARYGCPICSVLLEVLMFFGLDSPGDDRARNIELRVPTDSGNVEISVDVYYMEVYVQLYMSHQKSWNRIRPLPDLSTDYLSEESLSFIKSHLQTCLASHRLCCQGDGSLPARLLEVGHRGDSHIRLIDTDSVSSARYIALSYCWGNAITVRTTLASLEDMQSGIDVSMLPQVYVDAIALTRELGIQYLWVDALCIIQDSIEDWEAESANMSDIYAGAYLTIAAASSGSADRTVLRRHPRAESYADQYYGRVFTKRVADEEGAHMLKARVIPEVGVHSKWQDRSDERIPREPWSRRTWTLQEQLLSTRLLSFSTAEMQWTCLEAVACECRSQLNHRRLFGPNPVSQITRPADAFRFWHKLIENCSDRDLTDARDKLTAISGIAAILHRKTRSRYAAGLWADNIDADLLWRRAHPTTTEPPRPGYVAPSFSWASVEGEVDYCCFKNGKLPYHKSASVEAVETVASRNAPLGRVEGGRLTIRGPLIQGCMEESSRPGVYVVRLCQMRLVEVLADGVLQQVVVAGPDGSLETTVCRWSPSGSGSTQNLSTDTEGDPGTEEEEVEATGQILIAAKPDVAGPRMRCWVMRLGYFSSASDLASPQIRDHELLILGKSPRSPGNFERVGLATYPVKEGRSSVLEEVSEQEHIATITIV
ncbi:HET-domain-containing protein [Sodiomyces alkalinus F11]|uniref:HET-domain-containing protein n=1 Tax=Sodiomyces alkalinus (strain CBS 110278 / VKM F-3762 / F11) TaxID=1314773 RepID=A0A3N2PXB8_SODAK|nr:HET-domain-containing protein [Sodiomyces alkalinus F11]ROT39118.1 HET-domain-containing protein [Sodiomyces alkalinus F11]